jgi:hypothetical protein
MSKFQLRGLRKTLVAGLNPQPWIIYMMNMVIGGRTTYVSDNT